MKTDLMIMDVKAYVYKYCCQVGQSTDRLSNVLHIVSADAYFRLSLIIKLE